MTDAHKVVHGDTTDPGCWAGDSEYATCGARAVSDLGLCGPHLAELRDHEAPEPAGAAGHRATFAVSDETAELLSTEQPGDLLRRILSFTGATWSDGW